ncbi:transposable element Tcb1 transposase [Trichonephila clavipes]|nr:transposable element Tcb1 transposase [Trichonephila clavipes]
MYQHLFVAACDFNRTISLRGRCVRDLLDRTFPNRWIGCGGPVTWPSRSSDFPSLDVFLWGTMKGLVYDRPVNYEVFAAAMIRDTPGIFEQSISRRCHACINAKGHNFEHIL